MPGRFFSWLPGAVVWAFVCLPASIHAQQPTPADSLTQLLTVSNPDQNRVRLLLARAETVRDTNIQLALKDIHDATELSRQLGWPEGLVRTVLARGSCYDVVNQHEQAIAFYHLAWNLVRKRPALGALEVEALHRIAESYYTLGKDDSMLYYRNAALQAARREKVPAIEWQSLNFLAGYPFDQKRYPLAIQRWRELLRLLDAQPNRLKATMILNNMAEAYMGMNQPDSARALLERALRYEQEAPNERNRSYILYSFYEYYRQFGPPDSALRYARRAYESARRATGERTVALNALEAISALQTQAGHHRQALESYQAYIHLRDSVNNYQRKADGRRALMIDAFNRQMSSTRMERDRLFTESRRRRDALLLSLAGLLLFAGLTGLLFGAWLRIRRQRNTIQGQSSLLQNRSQSLAKALEEKELLMKEIHHRVKNNLQMISALQHLQASRSKDPAVRTALEDSQNRVLSIAFIHQNLYQHNDLDKVDIQSLLRELTGHIQDVYGHGERTLTITQTVTPGTLDIDTAVPLGLIINQLLTNSCKHAFDGRRAGQIAIRFQEAETGHYRLEYEDDGPGLPPELTFENARTLGLRLISRLVEQLEGTLQYAPVPVNRFTSIFKSVTARTNAS